MSAQLTFVVPPPGLAPAVHFELSEVDGPGGLFKLVSATAAGVRLFALDPTRHVPGYAPAVPAADLRELGLADGEDPLVLVVATPEDGAIAVNLMAPVVINPDTGAARQIILEGQGLPVHAELALAR